MTLEEFKAAEQLLKGMKDLDREQDLWHDTYRKFLEKEEDDIVTLYTDTCCHPHEIHMRVDEFMALYHTVTRRIAEQQNILGAEFDRLGKEPPDDQS